MNYEYYIPKLKYPEKSDFTTWVLTDGDSEISITGITALFDWLNPNKDIENYENIRKDFFKLPVSKMLAKCAPFQVKSQSTDVMAYHKACADYYEEQDRTNNLFKTDFFEELGLTDHPKKYIFLQICREIVKSNNLAKIVEIGKILKALM